ncbi:MAG TPA: hypothetical protein VG097_09100 [Gemmata sp.]|jgi:hypothetical protein|nr:hypothetical protein [Gemmata sp.]
MQKVQLSTEILTKLHDLSFTAELCDEAGTSKAVVLPLELYRELFSVWDKDAFKEDDLQQARSEKGGYTTVEAITYLKKIIADRGGR